jgi:ribose-phosphate pyrophosphokinase
MKINKYPDGSSYVQGSSLLSTNHIFKINSYENLWQLNQFVDCLNNQGITPNITIPNLIDAQADRRFQFNQSSGLKLVCKFLNEMNAKFKIFHPHNPEVVEALMDNVEIIDNNEFITKILLESLIKDCPSILQNGIKNDNLILMSSDAGGFKPLMKLCDKIKWQGETFSASKARMSKGMTQMIGCEDFNGKDILIIDDICVYGGTFKGLSQLLRERNCGKLYLAVSHMTVQNIGEDPVTNYFDKVFTTNSKYDEYFTYIGQGYDEIMGVIPENLEIIKMF